MVPIVLMVSFAFTKSENLISMFDISFLQSYTLIFFLSSSESSWLLRIDSKLLWQFAVNSDVTSIMQNHGVTKLQ